MSVSTWSTPAHRTAAEIGALLLEPLHQLALVPGAAVILRGPRRIPGSYLLLALAFAASWVGDSLSGIMGGSWVPLYGWVPVQMLLALFAVEADLWRWVAIPIMVGLVPISIVLTYPGPEILIMVLGSGCLMLVTKGRFRWPIFLYFGIGTVMYIVMVMGSEFITFWYGYQAARVAGIMAFVALVFTHRRAVDGVHC